MKSYKKEKPEEIKEIKFMEKTLNLKQTHETSLHVFINRCTANH